MESTPRAIPAKPSTLKEWMLNDEPVSFEEYLEQDANDERRLEYYDGWIVNVTGANWNHNVIVSNLVGLFLKDRLRSGCQPVAGDMRVAYGQQGRYVYPGLAVCCGQPTLEKHDGVDTLLNPRCIAEVLSAPTADYDQGKKFHRYRQIDTLQTYFVIAQDEPQVTLWTRGEDNSWTLRDISGRDASFGIEDIGVSIEMRQLYANVFDSMP